ncbi:MAG: IS3 family transposase [Planctomycetota bacterium]|nr:MAG: IS3 family transposase [Planctomycetota bacterium]
MNAVKDASSDLSVKAACEALGVPRSSFYRHRWGRRFTHPRRWPRPTRRALTDPERQEVLDVLHSEPYVDKPPAQVWAAVLDHEERLLCSMSTMYRILAANGEVRERRNQLQHPRYVKPVLEATGPKQIWSWDITKLRGPEKRVFFSLYVILDIFSRCVVGWLISERECAELAEQLFRETCEKEGVEPGEVTAHSDRGPPMTAKTTTQLLADLGLTQSFSRPRVSNDNAYSESQFKTLKYRPEFPGRFGSLADARAFCRRFFEWYNREHYHSSLGLLTPWSVHSGEFEQVLQKRQEVLNRAYAAHPERFVRGRPTVKRPPTRVWINEPQAVEISK